MNVRVEPTSADFFETTFEASPVGLAILDREGRYIRVNAELAAIHGRPAGEHIGLSIRDIAPERADAIIAMCGRIFDTGEGLRDVEVSGTNASLGGELRHWLCGFIPLRGEDGEVAAVGIWITDITAQRRTLEKLRMGIEAASLVMAEIDYRTDENHISAELARLLEIGDGAMTVPRQLIFDRIHPDDRKRYLDAIARTVDPSGNGHLAIDVRALLPSGIVRWLHIRLQVTFGMLDGVMKPDRGICAARDVTAEREAEIQLREGDRRKDEFIATLAHELRNPLAPVRTGLDILKRLPGLPEQAVKARDIMERQLTHMVRLVDDLLDVSRISRDKLELRIERLDVARVVEHAVEACQPMIEAAGHTLSVKVPTEAIHVDGDLTRLAQVLGNLLNNAAKYTPRGGRIGIEVRTSDREVAIEVRDTGVGLPGDMHVFELFAQGERSRYSAQGGLGIGLWLVRKLVELHGGTIEAHSAGVNQGSRFIVNLPMAG